MPTTNPNAAFFSDFAPFLATTARRLTASTANVVFDRFGFATPNDFERESVDGASDDAESLLFENARGARFLLVAPRPTFRLLFDAALGFDVSAICANEALWAQFAADARFPLTPFELDALSPEFERFAALCPLATDDDSAEESPDAWRPVSFARSSTLCPLDLDDDLVYWERRLIRLAERVFPWTFFVSTRRLAPTADAAKLAEPRRSSPPLEPSRDLPPSERTFEFSVVVERGEASADFWRNLKPGDVLTTNAPSNALFLGLLDGEPRFLCRPGLFRGAAAAQIVSEAGDGRE
ncbi:MAG: hypothetical protein IKU86_08485 [Thermoguttaceae bacterium]|nr:hypothetical protein [Thermoguttaceae bacterium]